jgi:peptide-methionine (S)-S-oxide reductase
MVGEANAPSATREVATFGGGCFWCIEAVFEQVRGVDKVESGYAGGTDAAPSYQQVCTGRTGHAEVVQMTFDPTVISYRDILDIFFAIHDPTSLNRQGSDVGTQYRSVIYYHSPQQKRTAEDRIRELNATKIWDKLLVTEVAPFQAFHKAEEYHQHYFQQNPTQPYCQLVVSPKVDKFRKEFAARLKR